MVNHIQELLNLYQYSEDVKEAAAFRVLFGYEDGWQVMQELGVHNVKAMHHWVPDYQRKIEQIFIGLATKNRAMYSAALSAPRF